MRIAILVEGKTETAFKPYWNAYRLAEVFRTGSKTESYIKTRDAGRILKEQDLSVAIEACAELKAFVKTIIDLSSG